MAKKHDPGEDLKTRVERTRREGRYQHALDLVKQLYKAEPTPQHKELLKDTYFQRAVQLRGQGYNRDAATVLEVAMRVDENDASWRKKLAAEMARCGEVARTLTLAAKLPEDDRQPLMGSIADGAIFQGKAGRDALPAPLQAEYDAVVKAFAHVEAGQDDEARETLNAIGLRSPFLEWKLLIRGFQAYYQNDDARARDNWQRLNAERLPARLASPFRAAIDPAYRDAQLPQNRAILAQLLEQFQGSTGDRTLREIRADLGNDEASTKMFRNIEKILPDLRRDHPKAAATLARCVYWSIIETSPEDISRYRRTFGAPEDDRNFHRLRALAYQHHASFRSAHEHWLAYEKEIAAHPEAWPGDQAKLARALIWNQMADNAVLMPSEKMLSRMPGIQRLFAGVPEALKPGVEECFNNALELAPKLLEPHEHLFLYHLMQDEEAKAIKAAERLLEVFPDHVKTLDELARLHLKKQKPASALPLLERALRLDPLSRDLRYHMQLAQSSLARELTGKGKFDEARTHFRTTIDYCESHELCSAYCQWAACEMKAGDESRASELLEQARAKSPGELLINYNLLVESNRLSLGNAVRTRYTKAFNSEITGTPAPDLAVALIRFVRSLDLIDLEYYGQKTHWKKIYDYAGRVDVKACTQAQLESLLGNLVCLDPPRRLVQGMLDKARALHPKDPFFPYYELISIMGEDPEDAKGGRHWRLTPLISHIEKLARDWPADARTHEMLEDLKSRRATLQMLDPFSGLFGAGGPFGFFGGDDDDF